MDEFQPKDEKKPAKPTGSRWSFVSLGFELGFIIALPIVLFGTFGKWLDGRSGTFPLFTLIGIVAAITSTTFWMYRRFKNYFDKIK